MASVSKQVAAFAILLLESQGKLSLNDNLDKYIPEMPDYARGITLKHMVYQTSGLRDYWELLSAAGWRYDDVITSDQVFNLICSQKGLTSRPGYEEFNTNMSLRPGYIITISSEEQGLYAEGHEVPKSRLLRTSEKEFTLPMMTHSVKTALTESGRDRERGIPPFRSSLLYPCSLL